MHGRRLWILVGVICLAALAALVGWGLTGSLVTAGVVDARDGKPLPLAEARLDGHKVSLLAGSLDQKAGLGSHTLTVTAPGYETVSRSFKVAMYRTTELGTIALRNADLDLTVLENYVLPRGVKAAKVTVGEVRTRTDGDGEALLEALPVGAVQVTLKAPGYEQGLETVQLKPGSNALTLRLTPTVAVVAKRQMEAAVANDHVVLWKLLHPVRQAQYKSKARFIAKGVRADNQAASQVIEMRKYRLATPVHLATYRDKPSRKTFHDVYRVTATIWASSAALSVFGIPSVSFTMPGYWVKMADGQWRCIGDGKGINE